MNVKVTVPESLLTQLLPGPVTLVFERTQLLNAAFNPDTNLIGVRIPDNKFIRSVSLIYFTEFQMVKVEGIFSVPCLVNNLKFGRQFLEYSESINLNLL